MIQDVTSGPGCLMSVSANNMVTGSACCLEFRARQLEAWYLREVVPGMWVIHLYGGGGGGGERERKHMMDQESAV